MKISASPIILQKLLLSHLFVRLNIFRVFQYNHFLGRSAQIFKKYYQTDGFAYIEYNNPNDPTPTYQYICECNSAEINQAILEQTNYLVSQVIKDGFYFLNFFTFQNILRLLVSR